ncbi:hypothetical protein PAPHI01_1732 [Pancytospora philotis]|nr:hypothetical protein PAPHI01_1732 [Pancytospora philotis]
MAGQLLVLLLRGALSTSTSVDAYSDGDMARPSIFTLDSVGGALAEESEDQDGTVSEGALYEILDSYRAVLRHLEIQDPYRAFRVPGGTNLVYQKRVYESAADAIDDLVTREYIDKIFSKMYNLDSYRKKWRDAIRRITHEIARLCGLVDALYTACGEPPSPTPGSQPVPDCWFDASTAFNPYLMQSLKYLKHKVAVAQRHGSRLLHGKTCVLSLGDVGLCTRDSQNLYVMFRKCMDMYTAMDWALGEVDIHRAEIENWALYLCQRECMKLSDFERVEGILRELGDAYLAKAHEDWEEYAKTLKYLSIAASDKYQHLYAALEQPSCGLNARGVSHPRSSSCRSF